MFKESRPSGLNHTAGSTSESAQIATASHAMRRQALLSFIGMPTHTDSASGGCAAATRLTPWHNYCFAVDLMLSRISTIAVFFLVALEISSCNSDCSGTYNCPLITMSISVPADISVRVRLATGDTCTPTVDAGGSSIGITSTTMHPCLVR